MKYQNVKTIRQGLPCVVRVVNNNGDDCLTTYDHGDVATIEKANVDVMTFFNGCVDEFSSKPHVKLRPKMFIKPLDLPAGKAWPMAPVCDNGYLVDLDLSKIAEVLIQPVPLSGG